MSTGLRRSQIVSMLLAMLVVLAACGSGDDSTTSDADIERPQGAVSGGSDDGGSNEESAADYDASAEFEQSDDAEFDSSAIPASNWDRKVIRDGELELAVSDVPGAVRFIRDTVTDAGGFMAGSEMMSSDHGDRTRLQVEVPSSDFDSIFTTFEEGSMVDEVIRESTSTRDVSEEYVDLESRLRNLEATESRYVQLLERAETIDEILTVERELTRVRGDIEEITGRLNYLDQRTSFGRISILLFASDDAEALVAEGSLSETIREAWDSSMVFLTTVLTGVLTVLVFFWWFWPVALIGGLVAYRYYRNRDTSRPVVTQS